MQINCKHQGLKNIEVDFVHWISKLWKICLTLSPC